MQKAKVLKPLRVLLTAGPTRTYIDHVRFLSNFSTGRLGYLIAEVLKDAGAEVFAVVGPCNQPFEKLKLKKLFRVETNDEMERAIFQVLEKHHPTWGVFSAAILDFHPRKKRMGKISSHRGTWNIELVPTRKIIDRVSKKYPELKKIGFKLEWRKPNAPRLERFAKAQIKQKSYNAMVLNFLPNSTATGRPT